MLRASEETRLNQPLDFLSLFYRNSWGKESQRLTVVEAEELKMSKFDQRVQHLSILSMCPKTSCLHLPYLFADHLLELVILRAEALRFHQPLRE